MRNEASSRTLWLAAMLACLCLVALPRAAISAKAQIEEAVRALLQERMQGVDLKITLLPSAGHFPPCRTPKAFLPNGRSEVSAGRLSVGVRCGANRQQVRYVPVRISIHGDYLKVRQELRRGDAVDASDVEKAHGDLGQLPGSAVRNVEEVVGQQASRRLTPGTALLQRHVKRAPLVERGQRVVVERPGAGFVVSREGKAMGSGGIGETVRVRFGRRQVISATVSASGRLRVE